jgi:L-Ala-D/L-Glu epimerase / N-acetyl-D-glutamate racemase
VALTLEAIPIAIPFRDPYVTARGSLRARQMALVRLRDPDGAVGLGEAVPLSLRGGASLTQVLAELRGSAGEPSERMSAPARAALNMAQLDLRGRREGVPAWQLLGAPASAPIRCNATLSAGEPLAVAREAEGWAARGFETFKLKVGAPGDVATVSEVRRAAGSDARIRVDANGVWSLDQATLELGAMERHGLELAEEPVSGLEELALLRARTAIPLAADESVGSPEQASRARELGSCALATVKLAKVGGFSEAREIAAALPVYLSSALDGPIGIAAAGHLALALGAGEAGVAHGLATQLLFRETTAARGPELHEGHLHLPDGPGLGVELDEEAVERLRIDG